MSKEVPGRFLRREVALYNSSIKESLSSRWRKYNRASKCESDQPGGCNRPGERDDDDWGY